jgi:hypothetical protein
VLGRREARAFDEIHDGDGQVAEFFAGAPGRLEILAPPFRMFLQLRARVAAHERKIQRPPRQAEHRHPDQLALQKKLEQRYARVEDLLQHRNIDPALMIADDQIPAVAPQVRAALYANTRTDEMLDQPAVDRYPAVRQRVQHARDAAAQRGPDQRLAQGEQQQRSRVQHGVQRYRAGRETRTQQFGKHREHERQRTTANAGPCSIRDAVAGRPQRPRRNRRPQPAPLIAGPECPTDATTPASSIRP